MDTIATPAVGAAAVTFDPVLDAPDMSTLLFTGKRRPNVGDEIGYRNAAGDVVFGVVWADAPGPKHVWVQPLDGSDAVAVRLPTSRIECHQDGSHADWRLRLAAIESIDAAGADAVHLVVDTVRSSGQAGAGGVEFDVRTFHVRPDCTWQRELRPDDRLLRTHSREIGSDAFRRVLVRNDLDNILGYRTLLALCASCMTAGLAA